MSKKRLSLIIATLLIFTMTFTATASPLSTISSATDIPSEEVAASTLTTPLPIYDVHNIESERSLYLKDGITGRWFDQTRGTAIISWRDRTRYGFFNARITAFDPLANISIRYEFQLIAVGNCDDDYIDGLFDITKDGVLVASGIHGKLYGLDQPVGQYFKFYSDNDVWHMSAYITDRFDY